MQSGGKTSSPSCQLFRTTVPSFVGFKSIASFGELSGIQLSATHLLTSVYQHVGSSNLFSRNNVEVDCHFYLQRFPELKTGRFVRRGLIHCTLMWKKTTVSSYMWKIGWVWEIHTIINMSLVKHVIRVGWPKHVMQKNKLRKLGSCFCQRGWENKRNIMK